MKKFHSIKFALFLGICLLPSFAITGLCKSIAWQQSVQYLIKVDFDDTKHQFSGSMTIIYQNNSPDELKDLYFHLFYNAFQPGSMMDTRSRSISDPDGRVKDRISKLKPDEIGYQKIKTISVDKVACTFNVDETILKVNLPKALKSKKKIKIQVEFEAQVPLQIRRTGRNNKEGIDYSMAQWYPKLCAYDENGWHPNDYVAREFYGVVGDFEVWIAIDKKYILAATGELFNPEQIGYGYYSNPKLVIDNKNKLTWKWRAKMVHDFAWAADPDYLHLNFDCDKGGKMHFFYQKDCPSDSAWIALPKVMNQVKNFVEGRFGKYVYPQFSFVQAGDGGMEYPMMTLMLGNGKFQGLVGLATHEYLHSWYPMMVGTDESRNPWMDEGFASYVETLVMDNLEGNGVFGPTGRKAKDPFLGDYTAYIKLVKSGLEEPLSTPSDHYNTNRAYSTASYVKGALFLTQLEYITGRANFNKIMIQYYNKFLHKFASPDDFIRIAETNSNMELDWYKEYWVNTTNTIDYSIDSVYTNSKGKTVIQIRKIGRMPMPIDLVVEDFRGDQRMYYIPQNMMRGSKNSEFGAYKWIPLSPWKWTHPTYEIEVDIPIKDLKQIVIDPTDRMADIDRSNNTFSPK